MGKIIVINVVHVYTSFEKETRRSILRSTKVVLFARAAAYAMIHDVSKSVSDTSSDDRVLFTWRTDANARLPFRLNLFPRRLKLRRLEVNWQIICRQSKRVGGISMGKL